MSDIDFGKLIPDKIAGLIPLVFLTLLLFIVYLFLGSLNKSARFFFLYAMIGTVLWAVFLFYFD
jgi:hypothetical protein